MRGWREGWIAWRNARLKDERFIRFASRFPLTRPTARRQARELFDLTAGFVYAQTLAACVALELFPLLDAAPRTVRAVAEACDLPHEGAERLLKAAAALGLTERLGDGRFALGYRGASVLANPGVAEMTAHHGALYADLADPVGLLRRPRGGGRLSNFWPYAEGGAPDPESAAGYSALMAASQPMVARETLAAFDIRGFKRLLDIGGGEGAFAEAAAARAASLEVAVFDLPAVAERARARFTRAGIAHRASAHGGDVFQGEPPTGFDLVSLIRVLHDHDDEEALRILKAARAAAAPGATLLVSEPMAGAKGARAMGDAYFGLYLYAMGSGRPRTASELRTMIEAAGFANVSQRPTALPLITSVLTARA